MVCGGWVGGLSAVPVLLKWADKGKEQRGNEMQRELSVPPRSDLGASAAAPGGEVARGWLGRAPSPWSAVPGTWRASAQRDVLGCAFAVFNKGVQQARARPSPARGAERFVSASLGKGAARLPAWVATSSMGLEYPVPGLFYKPDELPPPAFEAQDLHCTSVGILKGQEELGRGGTFSSCSLFPGTTPPALPMSMGGKPALTALRPGKVPGAGTWILGKDNG